MKKEILLSLLATLSISVAGEYDNLFDNVDEGATTASSSESENKMISFKGEHTVRTALPAVKEYREFEGLFRSPWVQNKFSLTGGSSLVNFDANLDINIYEDSNKTKVEFMPGDIVAKFSPGKFTFALGYQTYSWGTADGVNPTDNINSRDYRYDASGVKIPIFGADLTWYPTEKMSLQALVMPNKKTDLLPIGITESIPNYLFDAPYISSVEMGSTQPIATMGEKSYGGGAALSLPPKDLSNSVMGGKYSLFLGKIDISLSYLYNYEKFYTPKVKVAERKLVQDETVFDPSIPQYIKDLYASKTIWSLDSIYLTRQRVQNFGLDFRTTLSRVGLWGEFGYTLFDQDSIEYGIDRSNFSGVLGIDYSFGESEQHYFNFQVLGSVIPKYDTARYSDYSDTKPNSDSLGSKSYMEEFYTRSISNELNFQTEKGYLGFATKLDFDVANGYLKPGITLAYLYPFKYSPTIERLGDMTGTVNLLYKPTDNLKIDTGFEGFYSATKKKGSDDIYNNDMNMFGLFYKESRAFLNVTYSWGI